MDTNLVLLPPPGTPVDPPIAARSCRGVLACGGDGTVHAVINQMDSARQTLGVLPLGRGNSLAEDCGCRTVPDALAGLHARKVRLVDLMVVELNFRQGPSLHCKAINAVAFGALAEAVDRSRNYSTCSDVGYYLAGLLNRPLASRYRACVDGAAVGQGLLSGIIVQNTAHIGRLVPSPGVRPDDGVLDVLLLQPGFLEEKLFELWAVLGGHARSRCLARGSSVEIETNEAEPLYVDGEIYRDVVLAKICLAEAPLACITGGGAP